MMNKILTSLLLTVAAMTASAQSYTVYSVIGNTRIVEGRKTTPLQTRKQLTARTRLMMEKECAVTLLDEKAGKMYSFSQEGQHTVGQLIEQSRTKSKHISRQYMSYLIKQLFSDGSQKMSHPDTYMQVTATSYRSASSDSMLLSRMALLAPQGGNGAAELQLCSPETEIGSDMKVRFELVSCDTGFTLGKEVEGNTGSYVRVHNDTEDALYVNVLDIDEKGNKYLVLPVDEAATCAHLLVPPMSTVSFKSEPFIFSDERMKETFILIATEEPVDFSILMNPISTTGGKTMKSGFFRKFYQVQ